MKVRQTQQILLKNVHKNILNILSIYFLKLFFGWGAENNPVWSSISDQCYFYADYDKDAPTRACFKKKFGEQNNPQQDCRQVCSYNRYILE